MTRRELLKLFKKKSRLQEIVRVYCKNKMAVLGIIIFTAILTMSVFADVIADYNTRAIQINPANRLQSPSAQYILGTDELGREVFARIIHGSRISLRIGISSVMISLLLGGAMGACAGYFGEELDNIIMRFTDIFACLPNILLAIAIVAAFGTSQLNLMLAIGIGNAPLFARVIRAAVLSVRNTEYVEAARAIGARNYTIITQHVLINCMGPIIVQTTINLAMAILNISALSFMGLGIQAPTPEWGSMLASGRQFMRGHAYLVLAPGLAIFLSIFSLNLVGDGFRDAFDPRLKQ